MDASSAPERRYNQVSFSRREKIIGGFLAGVLGVGALALAHDISDGGDMHGEQLVRVGYEESTLYDAVDKHVDITGHCIIGKVVDSVSHDERNQQVLQDSEIVNPGLVYMPVSCD